jgi:SAM-dependent methyltransferase
MTSTLTAGRPDAADAADCRRFLEQRWHDLIATRPPGVRRHLTAERAVVRGLLRAGRYDAVAEVGCGDGTLLMADVVHAGLHYLGIDVAGGAVTAAELRAVPLRATSSRSVLVVQADAADLATILTPALGELRLLVAFPFNVFGNLLEPWAVVRAVAELDAGIAVLTYDTTAAAAALRAEYYAACALPGRLERDDAGVRFRCGPFRSDVHRPAVLRARLRAEGFDVAERTYGPAGRLYHGTRVGDRPPHETPAVPGLAP